MELEAVDFYSMFDVQMNSEQDSADALVDLLATAMLEPLKVQLVKKFESNEYNIDSDITR